MYSERESVFRAACHLRSLLTSSCDHSFHIRGSFTASLTIKLHTAKYQVLGLIASRFSENYLQTGRADRLSVRQERVFKTPLLLPRKLHRPFSHFRLSEAKKKSALNAKFDPESSNRHSELVQRWSVKVIDKNQNITTNHQSLLLHESSPLEKNVQPRYLFWWAAPPLISTQTPTNLHLLSRRLLLLLYFCWSNTQKPCCFLLLELKSIAARVISTWRVTLKAFRRHKCDRLLLWSSCRKCSL